jgi:hypothetical protein
MREQGVPLCYGKVGHSYGESARSYRRACAAGMDYVSPQFFPSTIFFDFPQSQAAQEGALLSILLPDPSHRFLHRIFQNHRQIR